MRLLWRSVRQSHGSRVFAAPLLPFHSVARQYSTTRQGVLCIGIKFDIMDDMRIALDTDVFIASVRSKTGASRYILKLIERKRLTAVTTVNMLIEYEAILKRQEHLEAAGLSLEEADKVIDALAALVEPITPHFLWRPQLKDPNDEMILEAAANGQADAIVTFNRKHFARVAPRFGIEVMQPADLLRRLFQ